MDRGALRATVCGVVESRTRLKQHGMHECLCVSGFIYHISMHHQFTNHVSAVHLPAIFVTCVLLHVYVYLCVRAPLFSCVQLPVTPRAAAHQAPLSMGFSRQEAWSGLPCPPPGDLPNPGIKPAPLTSPALAGVFSTAGATWEAMYI